MHHTMLDINVIKNNQTSKGRDFCFDQIQTGTKLQSIRKNNRTLKYRDFCFGQIQPHLTGTKPLSIHKNNRTLMKNSSRFSQLNRPVLFGLIFKTLFHAPHLGPRLNKSSFMNHHHQKELYKTFFFLQGQATLPAYYHFLPQPRHLHRTIPCFFPFFYPSCDPHPP